jgi:uncharacterized lipoprotein YajG
LDSYFNAEKKRELIMKKVLTISIAMLILGGCSSPNTKQAQEDMAKPVNCATAEGDIRSLNAEKAHTSQEIAAGVSSIVPISAVAHMVEGKGKEKESIKVGTGEYNKALDKKIAEIKKECGID